MIAGAAAAIVALAIENDSHYSCGMPGQIQPSPSTAATPAAGPAAAGHLRQVDSATLLGTQREVLIVHAQQVYRLRVTALGKLILTK